MGLASRLVERVLGRRLFDDSSDGMVELEVTSPAAGAVLVAALEQMGLSVAAAECPGDREESDSRMRVLVRRDQYWVAVERLEHHR